MILRQRPTHSSARALPSFSYRRVSGDIGEQNGEVYGLLLHRQVRAILDGGAKYKPKQRE